MSKDDKSHPGREPNRQPLEGSGGKERFIKMLSNQGGGGGGGGGGNLKDKRKSSRPSSNGVVAAVQVTYFKCFYFILFFI